MVRTDPGSLSKTTVARIGSRGNQLPDRVPGAANTAQVSTIQFRAGVFTISWTALTGRRGTAEVGATLP
jgi:hypothetical protein